MANQYIQWHATHKDSHYNRTMTADTVALATRAAKQWMDVAYHGQGSAVITVNGQPVRQITKSADTGWTWKVETV